MIRRYLTSALIILAFSGCSNEKLADDGTPQREKYYRPLLKNSNVIKLDQLIVLDQILLTLKEINTKLTTVPKEINE